MQWDLLEPELELIRQHKPESKVLVVGTKPERRCVVVTGYLNFPQEYYIIPYPH